MQPTIQVGTILMKDWPPKMKFADLAGESCAGNWTSLNPHDGLALDRRIHAAGWSFFFMAAEVKVMFLGARGVNKIQNAVKRILGKVKQQGFNGLEITQIVAKRFLGVPYTVVSAHSRHVQKSCSLDSAEARQIFQHDTEWARA